MVLNDDLPWKFYIYYVNYVIYPDELMLFSGYNHIYKTDAE